MNHVIANIQPIAAGDNLSFAIFRELRWVFLRYCEPVGGGGGGAGDRIKKVYDASELSRNTTALEGKGSKQRKGLKL